MIKLIRLVSGEEIIAEIKHEESNPDAIVIKDAIVLIPAGEGKIGIMPFMPYTKAKDGLELGGNIGYQNLILDKTNVSNATIFSLFTSVKF